MIDPRAAVLTALLAALALPACGGDDEEAPARTTAAAATQPRTTAPEEQPRTAFARAAKPICDDAVRAREQAERVVEEQAKSLPREALPAVVAGGVLRTNTARIEATRKLAELDAPPGQERTVQRWLSARRSVARHQRRYAAAVEAEKRKRLTAVVKRLAPVQEKSTELADKLGIADC